eukprot:scaffold9164_cov29-Tisochrysis_lutea.AAC.7
MAAAYRLEITKTLGIQEEAKCEAAVVKQPDDRAKMVIEHGEVVEAVLAREFLGTEDEEEREQKAVRHCVVDVRRLPPLLRNWAVLRLSRDRVEQQREPKKAEEDGRSLDGGERGCEDLSAKAERIGRQRAHERAERGALLLCEPPGHEAEGGRAKDQAEREDKVVEGRERGRSCCGSLLHPTARRPRAHGRGDGARSRRCAVHHRSVNLRQGKRAGNKGGS